jgi:hypothetical protein
LQGSVEVGVFLQGSVEFGVFLQGSVEVGVFLWVSVEVGVFLWGSVEVCVFLQGSVEVCVFLWVVACTCYPKMNCDGNTCWQGSISCFSVEVSTKFRPRTRIKNTPTDFLLRGKVRKKCHMLRRSTSISLVLQ